MNEALLNRWNISVKTLSMALEKEVSEGVLTAIREKITDSYLEIVGETGEEPDRPEFSDQIFDECFGEEIAPVDKVTRKRKKGTPKPPLLSLGQLEQRMRKVKRKKSKPSKKKSAPKRKKPAKKSVKKVKKKTVKRINPKKKLKAKRKRK